MNKESIFLFAHASHTFFSNNWFEDYVIVFNISHYAYTSSIIVTDRVDLFSPA